MGLQVIPILKALAPLVVNASGLLSTVRSAETAGKIEDRLRKLEEEALRGGELLTGVTQQLQALAQELRVQAEVNESLEKKARLALIFSLVAMCAGLAALAVAILR